MGGFIANRIPSYQNGRGRQLAFPRDRPRLACGVVLVTDERCTGYSSIGHPERPERILRSTELLRSQTALEITWETSAPAPHDALLRAHVPEHIERIRAAKSDMVFVASYPNDSVAIVRAANTFYMWVHFPGTAAFLLWAWYRHRQHFGVIRASLVSLTLAGLILHLVFPLAPPRMLKSVGYIDTGAVFGGPLTAIRLPDEKIFQA